MDPNFTRLISLITDVDKLSNAIRSIRSIKKFIKENPNEINKVTITGTTALMIAIMNLSNSTNNQVIRLLLKNGADFTINVKNNDGNTALILACARDQYDIAELLIKYGADTNVKNGVDRPVIVYALTSNNYQMAKLLLDNGADPNATDTNGSFLLTMCSNLTNNMAKLLIDSRFNVNASDNRGITVLMKICITGKSDLIKLLIDNGADCNVCTAGNMTALLCLCMGDIHKFKKSDSSILMDLIIHSKNVLHVKNSDNKTAYDYYIRDNIGILDEYQLKIFSGEIGISNMVKSARKI